MGSAPALQLPSQPESKTVIYKAEILNRELRNTETRTRTTELRGCVGVLCHFSHVMQAEKGPNTKPQRGNHESGNALDA